MRSATVTIHQDALAHNLQVIKDKIQPTTKVLAMVKADAYGHGVAAAVPALKDADGFGVACMSEAQAVRDVLEQHQLDKPVVLIEGVFSEEEWLAAIEQDFGCVIHNQDQLSWAIKTQPAKDSFCRTIWLKYNTGMNRIGFDADSVIIAAQALIDAGYQLILTSHFACSDEKEHPMNTLQITRFNDALAKIQHMDATAQGSLCNSAGIFNFSTQHHHWVRAGIALYGAKPVSHATAKELTLKPAMSLTAKVMALHTLQAGDAVGYAALWTATDRHQIAIISIGYGDGYPRVVDDAKVAIKDIHGQCHLRPIIGRVAMDMLMVDAQDLAVEIGCDVELWGSFVHIDEIALCASTIGYELMCRLTTRPTRAITSSTKSA